VGRVYVGFNQRGVEAVPLASAPPVVSAALFDLSHPAHYLHWHFFQMSVANVIVLALMIAVFIAAILIPFPKRHRES
jgi:hypothetical protein